jgi:hypothetical protein
MNTLYNYRPHAFQLTGHDTPVLSPDRVSLELVPLTRALPSIPSATVGCPVLFRDFAGTTALYDCLCSCIVRLRPGTC